MIFVDAGAWIAAALPQDTHHNLACHWFTENTLPLITTDYVVDEVLSFLQSRKETKRTLDIGNRFFESQVYHVEFASKKDVHAAWTLLRNHTDKYWSLTDCLSRIVMERLGIKTAFAFDQHFRQFGCFEVVP